MPFPLLPFALGAAAGAAVTYFLTKKAPDREVTADRTLPRNAGGDSEAPSPPTPTKSSDTSESPENA
jgi:hypothetical protein